MSYAQLLRSSRAAKQAELDELTKVEARDFTPEIQARADALVAELSSYDERITAAVDVEERAAIAEKASADGKEKVERVGGAVVTAEERTYTAVKSQRGEASFFADAVSMQQGDMEARTRIERHGREVLVEGEVSTRATTTSSFAGLIVPQYLVDQAALVARAGRPFANTVQRLQLPDQGTTFQIPRGTTGAATAIQATENSSVQSTDEVWANVTVNVATIAGQQDISRQSLERGTPGIDSLVYLDLAGAYAANLDTQVVSGSGSSGQMLGVQNTSGINQATAFGAAATVTTFYSKVAGQLNAVETTRFMAPTAIAMHPRRWNWLVSQVDSSGRPLVTPKENGPYNATAVSGPLLDTGDSRAVGSMQGLPVITDANIPTSVGTGPEDLVWVYRAPDLLLWEDGDGMPRQLRFEQTLGNQLTVKLVVYGYAAFTAGRYPTAVGQVGGNAGTIGFGLIAPTF